MSYERTLATRRMVALCAVVGLAMSGSVHAQTSSGVQILPPIYPAPPPMPTTAQAANAPTGPGMSLDQVIATVLTADPKLRVGNEEINQAIADATTAALRPNPTLGVDGQLLPLTRPFTPQQQGGPPQFDAAVSYPIDWFLFGKRKAAMASSTIGVRQTESEYYDLIRQRVRDASLLYYDILELKALSDVARQDVENLTRVEAITRKAVVGGGRPEVDANRIRLDLLRSQQFLRDAEMAVANAKSRLRAMLGRNDADPSFDVAGSLDLPASTPVTSVDEAIELAQQNRPDITALRLKVEKSEAETLVQYRKAFPDVAVKAGYSRQFQGSIGFRDADTFLVGVDVTLPIFDRNQGNRARAASALAQSHFQVQSSLIELRSEIEQVLNEFRMAQLSAQAVANEQLKLAEQVRDAINKANEAGGRPLLDVLDAQRNYRDTFRLYVTSRANYWRANARLSATLGKKMAP